MNLFSSAGLIVQLPADSQLLSVYLQDIYSPDGAFTFGNRLAIITASSTKEGALYQLRTMFNDKWYLNVFGDNPGMMTISGMFAGAGCNPNDLDTGRSKYSGFELISTYYRQHRLSNRMLALPVAIGGLMSPMVYNTFLADCQIGVVDPQLQVGQFSLTLVYPMPAVEVDDNPTDEPPDPPDDPDDPIDPPVEPPGSPGDGAAFLL
jgi:hypothetical protein